MEKTIETVAQAGGVMDFYIFGYWFVGSIVAVIRELRRFPLIKFTGYDLFMCCAFMSWFWPLIGLSFITLKKGY